jgi:hypothetical protein
MNFKRHIDPISPSDLNIGRVFLKREKIESLITRDFFSKKEILLGLGEIISLILHSKDVEIIEIFKEDFLQYFAIPIRNSEGWRWMVTLENLPRFPKKDQIKVRDLIIDIHDKISFS